ncbi:MAG TPA: heavy-metal-associated domain-containing protein [Chitinophagaceae bacterium]|nr:heavy-metal-associated domain-containing protein [Chitinophagaceae bacterium]
MKTIIIFLLVVFGFQSNAQFSKASLQASGLTCSMCSKAVKMALEKVSFVDKIQVDIKNQQYNLTFKEGQVDFDALSKAVEDAGFSVAGLKVTTDFKNVNLKKDEHLKIGQHYFHFLNANNQQLNGSKTFSIVDKQFVSDKDFKKYNSLSKLSCVQTGKATGVCCIKENIAAQKRVYHVII